MPRVSADKRTNQRAQPIQPEMIKGAERVERGGRRLEAGEGRLELIQINTRSEKREEALQLPPLPPNTRHTQSNHRRATFT